MPVDVPPVPKAEITLKSASERPCSFSWWSISGAVTASCDLMFSSLSYCSGQKPP